MEEKENNGKFSFDTFDLNTIMNCCILIASHDIEHANPVTSENGNIKFDYIYT